MNVLDGEPIKIKLLVKLLYQDFTQQTVSGAAHDQGQRWKKAWMHRRCKMNLQMIDTKVDWVSETNFIATAAHVPWLESLVSHSGLFWLIPYQIDEH